MMSAKNIIDRSISFFEKRGHKRIPNAPLIPQNDPTTLFTSSGMQPLVPYLLGEPHPKGKRLVNVQNCFRAQDIEEVGDNRHTTFFRMLGNWSLGDYFKKKEIAWFWEFLTKELNLDKKKLFITVFKGINDIPKDEEAVAIWNEILTKEGLNPAERIFYYSDKSNWWSRAGTPEKMPPGEPGGPSTEVFYEFDTPHNPLFGKECHPNCDCGKYLEIGNAVFMEYIKDKNGTFKPLPKKNIDFGGGLERLLAAIHNNPDIFQTNLLAPIIETIQTLTGKKYDEAHKHMRIVVNNFVSAVFILADNVIPSNKEQGYILRRLIRRGMDSLYELETKNISSILESIVEQYKDTDPQLLEQFESIKNTIVEEANKYRQTLDAAKTQTDKELTKRGIKIGNELKGIIMIPPDIAFRALSSYGLSPTQLKSLGYNFDEQELAEEIKKHQDISRKGAVRKFAGGLADHSEKTIMGHTATHLLHQALRDTLGNKVHQTGSNITNERVRFDFNFEDKLSDEQIRKVEQIINGKIKENLPVHFEILPVKQAKKIGAIGLFDEKYEEKVKVYFIGQLNTGKPYSIEFCGGPHVQFTSKIKSFKIIKQENIGNGQRRIYAQVGN